MDLRGIVLRRAKRAAIPCLQYRRVSQSLRPSALRSGCGLIALERMRGHSRLAVVSRYLRQVEDDLREAHDRVGPVDKMP
jgi:hypothetical protein